jgi:peptidoglycan/LPS O-acetylase OafA/YrhL
MLFQSRNLAPTSQLKKPSPHIASLDGLRGLAAYFVLLGHSIDFSFRFQSANGVYGPFGPLAKQFAYFGMSLFFVLSGFVITYNYAESFKEQRFHIALYRFFVARIARLYPLYALTIFLWWTQFQVSFAEHPGTLLAYLTMTASWFNVEQAVFPPAWSISTEFAFYFIFVLLAVPVATIQRFASVWFIATNALLIVALLAINEWFSTLTPYVNAVYTDQVVSAPQEYWFWYYNPMIRVAEFVIGVFACEVYLRSPPIISGVCKTLEIAAIVYCGMVIAIGAAGAMPFGRLEMNFKYAPALGILLICTTSPNSIFGPVLRTPVAAIAGEISYSVYMWQMVIMAAMSHYFARIDDSFGAYVLSTIMILMIALVTTFVSYGSFHLFEKPLRFLIRNALLRKPQKTQ